MISLTRWLSAESLKWIGVERYGFLRPQAAGPIFFPPSIGLVSATEPDPGLKSNVIKIWQWLSIRLVQSAIQTSACFLLKLTEFIVRGQKLELSSAMRRFNEHTITKDTCLQMSEVAGVRSLIRYLHFFGAIDLFTMMHAFISRTGALTSQSSVLLAHSSGVLQPMEP